MGRASRKASPKRPTLRTVQRQSDPKVDPQMGMFDLTIADSQLEQALLDYLEMSDERKAVNRNAVQRKEGMKRHRSKFRDGQRVRVGSVTFTVSEREGGDFDMPHWQTFVATGITTK